MLTLVLSHFDLSGLSRLSYISSAELMGQAAASCC